MRRSFRFFILAMVAFLLVGCSDKPIKGDGKMITESRGIPDFSGLEVKGNFSVAVKSGQASPDLRITTDQNLQPYLVAKVEDHLLQVKVKKGFSLKPSQPIRITVSAKKIKVLQIEGSSKLDLSAVSGELLTLETEGLSQTTLSGKIENFTLTSLDKSRVDARNLLAKNVDLKAEGSTIAYIYAQKKLNADLKGSAKVTYFGEPPVINQKVFGKSKLSKAGQ